MIARSGSFGAAFMCLFLLISCGGNSGLDKVLERGAKLTKVTEGHVFDTAGSPMWIEGRLFFTNNNLESETMSYTGFMDHSGKINVIRHPNGATTTLKNSGRGTLYCCEMLGHRVTEIDFEGNLLRIVCEEYDGRRIDGPNDLAVNGIGGIYFTDSQFIGNREKMQDTPAVYYVSPDGNVKRVIDDLAFPNGLVLSPDETKLFIVDTHDKYIFSYGIDEGWSLGIKTVFAELQLTEPNMNSGFSGADGVAIDRAGNIYVATTQGLGIQVFDNSGKHLGNIPCDVVTNNLNFGGEDLKTLYVSARDGIYSIRTRVPGVK